MQQCDLVLVEGFRHSEFPKLEVWREVIGKPLLWPAWPGTAAVASDGLLPVDGVKNLNIYDARSIADFFLSNARLR